MSLGQLSVVLLHWFFYRLFLFETLWLNLYLFGALVFVIAVFAGACTRSYTKVARLSSADHPARVARINQVARFRRQVRRKNAGFIRQR